MPYSLCLRKDIYICQIYIVNSLKSVEKQFCCTFHDYICDYKSGVKELCVFAVYIVMAEIFQIRFTENLTSSSHPHGFLVSNYNRFI